VTWAIHDYAFHLHQHVHADAHMRDLHVRLHDLHSHARPG
jgi:hypothetical protein